MFNEAFWFFYWVGVVGALDDALFALIVVVVIGTAFSFPLYYIEDIKQAKKWHTLGPVLAVVLTLAIVFLPSKDALYAGAGQYVAETTEVDDTLLKLKALIDKKIEEAAE